MTDATAMLADAARSGVFRIAAATRGIESSARHAGLSVVHIDAARARGKAGFIAALATALALPAHFGHNWDALHDSLTDEDVIRRGTLIVVAHADAFAAAHGDELATAIDIFTAAAGHWRSAGRAFWVLLRGAGTWADDLPAWPPTAQEDR